MITQYHGTYIGSRTDLQGKRAIVLIEKHEVQDMVPAHGQTLCETITAQFDDMSLKEGFGWYSFERSDFHLEYQYGVEEKS